MTAPEVFKSLARALFDVPLGAAPLMGRRKQWVGEQNGIKLVGADRIKAEQIYAIHLKRVTGEIDAVQCEARLRQLVGEF